MNLQPHHNKHFQPALFSRAVIVLILKLISITIINSKKRKTGFSLFFWKSVGLLVFERDGEMTPELDGWSRTWNDPSACWHAPCYGCLFLQGSQGVLASSLASSKPQNPVTAERKAWLKSPRGMLRPLCQHRPSRQPTDWRYSTARGSIVRQWGTDLSFSQGCKHWLLRTWQSFAVAPGEFGHHTVLENRLAPWLASVLAGPSLKNN